MGRRVSLTLFAGVSQERWLMGTVAGYGRVTSLSALCRRSGRSPSFPLNHPMTPCGGDPAEISAEISAPGVFHRPKTEMIP